MTRVSRAGVQRDMPMLGGGGGVVYLTRSLQVSTESIVMLLPFTDATGTTAQDAGTLDNDAGYLGGVALGASGIGDGSKSILLDGSTGRVNALPGGTGLATDLNWQEFTFSLYAALSNADVGSDGSADYLLQVLVNAQNQIIVRKAATPNNTISWIVVAGNVTKSISVTITPDAAFHHYALTFSLANDQMIAYIDGAQVGTMQTGLGTWVGTPTVITIGSQNVAGATPWNGRLAYARLDDVALTDPEVLSLGTPF